MAQEILLYYTYTSIDEPGLLADWQRELCQSLELKGRILIANEGINGTLEGTVEHTQAYIEACQENTYFEKVHFKRSPGTGTAFPKLIVKARSEIVSAHLGERDVNPAQLTGRYLSPEALHEWIHSKREFYIVDMRNDFEHAVGHFAGSILPKMRHFRYLPDVVPELEHLKNKTIVTVCTGGVRCEKASGFLLKHGFKDVYQLHDGIVSYMEKYPHEDFKGSLYVFDGRVTMGFNLDSPKREIIGRCELCGLPSEEYINCADIACHRHFICCAECVAKNATIYCQDQCEPRSSAPSYNLAHSA